jgi:hypothetical protein
MFLVLASSMALIHFCPEHVFAALLSLIGVYLGGMFAEVAWVSGKLTRDGSPTK